MTVFSYAYRGANRGEKTPVVHSLLVCYGSPPSEHKNQSLLISQQIFFELLLCARHCTIFEEAYKGIKCANAFKKYEPVGGTGLKK